MDIDYVFMTGTEMQIVAAGEPVHRRAARLPLSVKTLAGQSAPINVTYAGIPKVTGVVNTTNSTSLDGVYGGPDTGGTPIEIDWPGVLRPADRTDRVQRRGHRRSRFGTQYTYTVTATASMHDPDRGPEPGARRRPGSARSPDAASTRRPTSSSCIRRAIRR